MTRTLSSSRKPKSTFLFNVTQMQHKRLIILLVSWYYTLVCSIQLHTDHHSTCLPVNTTNLHTWPFSTNRKRYKRLYKHWIFYCFLLFWSLFWFFFFFLHLWSPFSFLHCCGRIVSINPYCILTFWVHLI